MKHEFIFLGKTKDTFISQGIDEYYSRLKHYTNCSISILKEKMKKGIQGIDGQAQLLLNAVSAGTFVVVLDSRGKQFTSESFAKKIGDLELRGTKRVSYLIGGPEGLSSRVIKRADMLLSFSQMTFTHDMVRMILLEQLYRAYTIKAGEKYHK